MIYKKISSKKSRTIGILDSQGKTRFKKVDFFAEVEIEEGENEIEARKKLSDYIDGYLDEQINKNK